MVKKVFDENNTEATVDGQIEPAVKQMTRTISSVTNEDHDSVYEVDRELTEWLKQGYKLMTAQIIGNDQQGVSVYYLLVRQ